MEQLKWTTPIKNKTEHENLAAKSPVIYKTPVKQYESNSKRTMYKNTMSSFSVLPSHITPPSGLTKFIARNPFESNITDRLHLSVISPTVFKKVSSPSHQSPDFAWSIDDLALIKPAKIEEFPVQEIHCTDPETEVKMQEAIDHFFKENSIIPSPWETKKKKIKTKIKVDTPLKAMNDLNPESSKSKKDAWSQTALTFPSELPSHVMEILKPYYTFTQEQNIENEDANSSNSSLRRKLFSNHEDCVDNKENTSVSFSPIKMNESLMLSSSPPQSGMLTHGPPLRHSPDGDCGYNTWQINSGNLSSPNISPIHSTVNMLCESTKSRSRSVARLDFTVDMTVDKSSMQYEEVPNNHSSDEFLNKIDIKVPDEMVDVSSNLKSNFTRIQSDAHLGTKILVKNSTPVKCNFETAASEFNFVNFVNLS
ncbi:unnamed protein product [Xylocopa violacea]|uniref:Protein aurora borealis n=1 Tax=Xylocopa violacea TaxID=135666 RepID=A0ABP1PHM1_XYLVO